METRVFEETKRIPVSPSYCVTESGRVGRIGSPDWLKPAPMKRGGYLAVSLHESGSARTWPIHQLVAIAFHGPRPSSHHHAAHDDGDKLHNHRGNVLWKTKIENEADKIAHGTSNRGDRNGMAKVSDAQCDEIRERVKALPRSSGGKRIKKGAVDAIAAEYGVTKSAIYLIWSGRRRAHEPA